MITDHKNRKIFRKLSILTIIAVYLLILVGGIVRSTGSGMGCPDWPKCFGSWIPPTHVDQLPANYQEVYSQKRAEKNHKFAIYLEAMGFDTLASEILNDKSILEEAAFNKTKTWIEYLNRLLGAVIGLLILATFISSFQFYKVNKPVFYTAAAALLLVIFQGWIGSIVVSTNLLPWMVTVHMLIALVIIALLIVIVYKTGKFHAVGKHAEMRKKLLWFVAIGIIASLIQIVLGTQVRESIDEIAASFQYTQRTEWIDLLGLTFYIHRSFSVFILLTHIGLWFLWQKSSYNGSTSLNLSKILLWAISLEVATGVLMAYFAIPAFLQPIHLLMATIIFGIQFLALLLLTNQKVVDRDNLIIYA